MKSITIYCASGSDIAPVYKEQARVLGNLMASRGISCVNGGGNSGLMAVMSDTILASGGNVTGVIPRFMVDNEWFHPHLTKMIVTEDMHSRKQTMAELSDGCIALPGGTGTLEELMEIITWKQLGLYTKPIVIFNINNYYQDLLKMLKKAINENFIHLQYKNIYSVAHSAEEALDMLVASIEVKNLQSIPVL